MIADEIFLRTADSNGVEPDKSEALRYLGIKSDEDADFEALYSCCLKEFKKAVGYKAVIAPAPFELIEKNKVVFPFAEVESECLNLNLSGAKSAFVFAATLGTQVDRLIMKYGKAETSKSVVIDAIASAAIEAFCDLVNDEFSAGRSVNHRYSPGYGDLSLGLQPRILEYLDAQRKLGIVLSNDLFMTPVKSVTAVFGVR